MSRQTYRLRNATRGAELAAGIARAGGAWERLVGLIGRRAENAGSGLWLIPCNGIHTFGMRFPLDILVLDRAGRVLRVVPGLPPWRVVPPARGGHSVVELPAGVLSPGSVRVGDLLRLEP